MFCFRLNKIKILDNHEKGGLFRKKKRDHAEVQILSFVTTEDTDLPNLDRLLEETNEEIKQVLLKEAVSAVISRKILTTVKGVKDGQSMFFGDTGYALFKSAKIPGSFDLQICLLEKDKNHDIKVWTESVMKNPGFGNFSKSLVSGLKTAAGIAAVASGPAFGASALIGKFALNVLTEGGNRKKDDQLGLLYASLTRAEHYPNGKRDAQDVPDLTGNMTIDYTVFGMDEVPVPAKPTVAVPVV